MRKWNLQTNNIRNFSWNSVAWSWSGVLTSSEKGQTVKDLDFVGHRVTVPLVISTPVALWDGPKFSGGKKKSKQTNKNRSPDNIWPRWEGLEFWWRVWGRYGKKNQILRIAIFNTTVKKGVVLESEYGQHESVKWLLMYPKCRHDFIGRIRKVRFLGGLESLGIKSFM